MKSLKTVFIRPANGLSHLGERYGIEWLIYNPLIFLVFHHYALGDPPAAIRAIRKTAPETNTWRDVGSGSGAFAAEALRQGLQLSACEYNPLGRWLTENVMVFRQG